MRTVLKAVVLMAVVAASSSSVSTQWPPYPTAGVPRLPNGQPNLAAPPPRTVDGKPDLSGIWENAPIRGGQQQGFDERLLFTQSPFWNIGAALKGEPPFQPWAKALRDKRNADHSKDNPDALCLPMGLMQFHTHPQPRKIIGTPGVIVILYEANGGIRQIFTDGRPLPNNDPQPWWYGYSAGTWRGDTLVVETTGFRDDGWLDVVGSPLTGAAKLTERFRRVNYGTLEIEITVDDRKAYTKPWTVKLNQRIMLDTELIEFVCAENQKFVEYLEKNKR